MARGADADVHEVALTLEDSLRQVISASKPAAPAVAEQRLLSLDTHGAKLVRFLADLHLIIVTHHTFLVYFFLFFLEYVFVKSSVL